MKIAFIGLKGIPAKWGGIEVYVEEIAKRLVQRGHEVTVYGANWYCKDYKKNEYLGIKIKKMPTIRIKATEALIANFGASLHALLKNYDVIHFHGFASYYYVPLLRIFRRKIVVTTHGYDSGWNNPKYNKLGTLVIKRGHDLGVKYAHEVTTVAEYIKRILEQKFNRPVKVLPSGISHTGLMPPKLIARDYGLKPYNFILFLGRIDPIKRIDWLIRAFKEIKNNTLKLVIAGGTFSSSDPYLFKLKQMAEGNSNIIFTGFVRGEKKAELLSNCRLFVLPSLAEGVPVSLIEAMTYRRLCLASDIPPHAEVITNGVDGFLFNKNNLDDLIRKLSYLGKISMDEIVSYGEKAEARVKKKFNWDKTTQLLENIYYNLI